MTEPTPGTNAGPRIPAVLVIELDLDLDTGPDTLADVARRTSAVLKPLTVRCAWASINDLARAVGSLRHGSLPGEGPAQ